jgi:hypothetical protein
VFVISVAAQLAGLHAQTRRFYDRLGLVSPGRSPGGGRRYSALLQEVQRLSQTTALTSPASIESSIWRTRWTPCVPPDRAGRRTGTGPRRAGPRPGRPSRPPPCMPPTAAISSPCAPATKQPSSSGTPVGNSTRVTNQGWGCAQPLPTPQGESALDQEQRHSGVDQRKMAIGSSTRRCVCASHWAPLPRQRAKK